MKLSIIIVNYNVRYYLKQCLASVLAPQPNKEGEKLELEVFVVDNDSVDGSVEMVQKDFPEVHVIANHDNRGFAKANNQALRQATGDFMLLLNPDTIVAKDTFVSCVDYMMAHPDCGGLCVKMVDGKGNFLKESKRGFPTPEASFYKISGLIRLFPHSKRIAAYYMGHLSDDKVSEIEIMPGAFMMFRNEVYRKIGGLDESYFMFGEDIDYSWRIHLAGYKNVYLPTTHIIHYKGESTRKASMSYVYTFYNAMAIFVSRYFSGSGAKQFSALLKMAIWARASLSWIERIAKKVAVPLLDFALAYGGFALLKQLWLQVRGLPYDYYAPVYITAIVPIYILILMLCTWLYGGYDKPIKLGRIARGMGIGLLLLLVFYSLLDATQRYSRLLLLAGSVWTLISTLLIRMAFNLCNVKGYALRTRRRGNIIIVGKDNEIDRVSKLYTQLGMPKEHIISTSDSSASHLQDIIRIENAEEVIFCGGDIDLKRIIELMANLRTTGVEYKIAPQNEDYVIGCDNVVTHDELFVDDLDTISTDTHRRNKRTFDIVTSLLLILFSPIMIWFQKKKSCYFSDCFSVLIGRMTWVEYIGHPGVIKLKERIMLRYMRHYNIGADFSILFKNINRI